LRSQIDALRIGPCREEQRRWTGLAALARPGAVSGLDVGEFSVEGAPRYDLSSPRRWVLSHVARYPWFVGAFFLLTAFGNFAYAQASYFTGLAAEEMLKPGLGRLGEYSLWILVILVGDGLSNLVSYICAENVAKGLQADARQELYLSLLGKSQTFHGRQRVGEIMARATEDTTQLSSMVVPGASLIIEGCFAIVIPCVYLATLSLELLLVPVVFIASHVLAVRAYQRELGPVMMRQRQQFGVLNAGLEETVSGIEVVKASAREGFERDKYDRVATDLKDAFVAQGVIEARYLPLFLFAVANGAMFLHCLWLYTRGALRLSDVITAMGLMAVLRFPTFISIFTFSLVQSGLAGAQRILDLIRARTELDENQGGHAGPVRGEVVFEDVSFTHGTRSVLNHLSFAVQPGQTVAIVGQTGSGKSTLTELVNRTYDPLAGRVLIDGVDTRAWSLHALRSGIGKIEQDIFLFSRSIADNIAFARPGATRPQIEQAARDAQAHEFISELAEGYDTVIGQRGVTLSGGQRQRIALARAFLSDPRILILDDSTSAIDSATEDEIQRALRRIQSGRTTLLITHRLSQIRWADVILVLEQGELVARGSHEALLRTSPHYRRIFARYDIDLPPLEEPRPTPALAEPGQRG
jgi:ATP-binding cassette, subfamily B, bacterial